MERGNPAGGGLNTTCAPSLAVSAERTRVPCVSSHCVGVYIYLPAQRLLDSAGLQDS